MNPAGMAIIIKYVIIVSMIVNMPKSTIFKLLSFDR